MLRIAVDLFGINRRIYSLTKLLRFYIQSRIIRILQIILNLIACCVLLPNDFEYFFMRRFICAINQVCIDFKTLGNNLTEIPAEIYPTRTVAGYIRRPLRRDILPKNNIFNSVLLIPVCTSVDGNCTVSGTTIPAVVSILITVFNIKYERVSNQFVVYLQYRTAVRLDNDFTFRTGTAGGCSTVSFIIKLISGRRRFQFRRRCGINSRTDNSRCRSTVFIYPFISCLIVFFADINDGIRDFFAVPLCIERGVVVDGDRAARRCRQSFVRIPSCEGVTVAGRDGGGDRLLGAVRHSDAADVGTAVGFVGQLEVLAGIVNVQLLLRLTVNTGGRDDCAFRALKRCVCKGLDGRGDVAVQNALNVALSVDLGITVAGEILQHVYKVIDRRIRNVLDPDQAMLVIVEIGFYDFNRRRFRIVDRRAGDLVGIRLRRGGRRDRIRQLAVFYLQKFGAEDDFTGITDIVVVHREVINIDGTELRNGDDVAADDRIRSDFGFSALNDPLLEDLALNERILRHGADGFARGAEILGQGLDDGLAVVGKNDEPYIVLIGEACLKREVGGDRLAARVLRFADIPADEVLAFDHRVGRQFELIVFIIRIGLIDFRAVHERDGEYGLVVFRPDVHVSGHGDLVGEVAAAVDPLAGVALLCRNGRNVVQTVAGVRVNGLCRQDRGLFRILIEGDGVGDLLVIRNDGRVARGNVRCADAGTGHADLLALTAGNDLADRPICGIIFTRDRCGELIADGFALHNVNRGMHFGVAVIERDLPGLEVLRLDRHVSRDGRFGGHFFAAGNPLVEDAAFGSFGIGGKRADRLAVADESRLDDRVTVHERDGPRSADLIRIDVLRIRREVDAVLARLTDIVVARGIPSAVAVGDLELVACGEVYRRDHVLARGRRVIVEFIARVVGRPAVDGAGEIVITGIRRLRVLTAVFGLVRRDLVAFVLRLDMHHAVDDRRRIDVLSELGIPADERAAFNLGRFGQLADRRSRQNRLTDKNAAVLVHEGHGEVNIELGALGYLGIHGLAGLVRSLRFSRFRRLGGLFRIFRLRGVFRIFRLRGLVRIHRIGRQIADQSAGIEILVVALSAGVEPDFIHTDFGAAAVELDDRNVVGTARGTVCNGCQRQQLQHHDERYDDRPGASAEKDPVQL